MRNNWTVEVPSSKLLTLINEKLARVNVEYLAFDAETQIAYDKLLETYQDSDLDRLIPSYYSGTQSSITSGMSGIPYRAHIVVPQELDQTLTNYNQNSNKMNAKSSIMKTLKVYQKMCAHTTSFTLDYDDIEFFYNMKD